MVVFIEEIILSVIVVQKVRSYSSIVGNKEKLESRVETFPLCKKKEAGLIFILLCGQEKTFCYVDYLAR